MKRSSRGVGFWLAVGCAVGFLGSGASAARTVSIAVEGASEAWVTRTASHAAQRAFQKLGYQVVEPGSAADTRVTLAIEKAYSHHSASPLCWFAGGIADLWNYDHGHASVTTTVMEGDHEAARRTASASKHEVPLFGWLQPARKCREAALRSAVNASLKEYIAGLTPAQDQIAQH